MSWTSQQQKYHVHDILDERGSLQVQWSCIGGDPPRSYCSTANVTACAPVTSLPLHKLPFSLDKRTKPDPGTSWGQCMCVSASQTCDSLATRWEPNASCESPSISCVTNASKKAIDARNSEPLSEQAEALSALLSLNTLVTGVVSKDIRHAINDDHPETDMQKPFCAAPYDRRIHILTQRHSN